MSRRIRIVGTLVAACALMAPAIAVADHATNPHTPNTHAKGHSPHPATFLGEPDGVRHVNSDLAFWGNLAFNGNYDGFRIIDVADPDNPTELSHTRCNGDQGDIFVWENILVRSWNSKKSVARTCDSQPVPPGWEGVHVFDISNTANPTLLTAVSLPCGSHTLTGARDGARLIVYSNNSSSAGCVDGTRTNDDPAGDFIDVIEIPLGAPNTANLLRREPLAGPTTDVRTGCHDMGLILGSVNLAACASADTTNVFDIGDNALPGGSLADPVLLYTVFEPGVGHVGTNGRWHSAAFSWDGKVLVLGWEPGGGAEPECQSTDPPIDKSMFFYDAATGAKLGQWVLPRGQDGVGENCTVHNYNIVPLRSGRHIAVGGHYQAGTWVTEFTDPANPVTLGWSDPPAITPPDLGGAWSSYWYNNFIYESSITEGVNVYRFSGNETAGAMRLHHLNPQTQEFSLP
ncbi:LVIVD repeat-containing protein [Actinokineospora xionganensis]|uniref:LVIVD repeat-containing protein n=1 Tax=Actinokineospora xionganensis TaxID=2684470 RepID=A0ABR7LBQ9_9PSEU|nr:hypothetical protein [Actinokineospora xionganensis]MBC6450149.1 hypothetical protein [Actinokineospora xionganensis]